MNIGKRIREIRQSRGMLQRELADRLGYTKHWLSQIETGERDITSKKIIRIAEALDVDVADLFFEQKHHDTRSEGVATCQ